MARRAWVGDLVLVRHLRRNERKRVRANLDVRYGRVDLWHMAGHALAAWRALLVMRMLLERSRARPIGRHRAVAIQTKLVHWLSQLRIVFRAVHVVAAKAGDSAAVHHALHKIVALHAVLMGRAVREMRESRLAQLVLFQFPKIGQTEPHLVTHRPVIVFSL